MRKSPDYQDSQLKAGDLWALAVVSIIAIAAGLCLVINLLGLRL